MVKMIEIRKVILSALKAIHPRVYFQAAPDNAVYPYLVYDLPNSIDDGSMERFVLDVDGWDTATDTTTLEVLMNSIDGDGDKVNPTGLHRKTFCITAGGFIMPTFPVQSEVSILAMTFYRENRLSLLDDDPQIRRRKYVYQVRTHE